MHRLRLALTKIPLGLRALAIVALAIALVALIAPPALRAKHHHAAHSPSGPRSPLPSASSNGVLSDPIDPRFLTELPFGKSSFWIQPWRAYMDTWPASRLLESVGINFDVPASQAQQVAHLLHDSGFELARVGINWSALSYEDPTRFADERSLDTRLQALRDSHLRPLILLDANSVGPAPAKKVVLEVSKGAPVGATTVRLSAASARVVVPGKTGFDSVAFNPAKARRKRRRGEKHVPLTPAQKRARREAHRAAGLSKLVLQGNPAILITKVSAGGVASLSRPLPVELAPARYRATTLLYAPFAAPKLPGGAPNPAFRQTMNGWLAYVATVCRKASAIFGAGGYDLEVWNEPTFGSQFLDAESYTANKASPGKEASKQASKALLDETVAYVRDPAHGISPKVGIADGFADQTPFASAGASPAGLTALSKHLYSTAKSFPADFRARRGDVPLDAHGKRDTVGSRGSTGALSPRFVPRFQALFPEYFLTALQSATVVRDLAPITTSIYGAAHGRDVAPSHGDPLQVWMTEYNLNPGKGTIVGPDGVTPQTGVTLTPQDKAHFQTKALLRSLVSMINKGMTREYFYHAAPGSLSLISEQFTQDLNAHPNTYPGDQAGGETLTCIHNLLTQFQGPGPNGPARQLTLLQIAQEGNHAQFTGDGTTAHPNLYDREVLAVLPFQSSPTRYVIPIYVMTRNLLTLYKPDQPNTNPYRYDLPNETFRITLGNLPNTTTPPTITLYDPIHNQTTPAHITKQTNNTLQIELTATDYPRTLTINYTKRG